MYIYVYNLIKFCAIFSAKNDNLHSTQCVFIHFLQDIHLKDNNNY